MRTKMEATENGHAQAVAGASRKPKIQPPGLQDLGFFSRTQGRELSFTMVHPNDGTFVFRLAGGRNGVEVRMHDPDLAGWAPAMAAKLPKLTHAEIEQLLHAVKKGKGEQAKEVAKALGRLTGRAPPTSSQAPRPLYKLAALRSEVFEAYEAAKPPPPKTRKSKAHEVPAFPFPLGQRPDDGIPTYAKADVPYGSYFSVRDSSWFTPEGKPFRLAVRPLETRLEDDGKGHMVKMILSEVKGRWVEEGEYGRDI